MQPAGQTRGPARRRMKLRAYEHLFLVNQGYDQVARSLKALAKYFAGRPKIGHQAQP